MNKLLLCKKHRWRFQIQSWAKEVRHKAIDYMEGLWFLPYRVVFKKYFIWLHWALVASLGIFSCSIRDVVPWPGFKPRCSVLGVGSHSHWATREAPRLSFFNWKLQHERLKNIPVGEVEQMMAMWCHVWACGVQLTLYFFIQFVVTGICSCYVNWLS